MSNTLTINILSYPVIDSHLTSDILTESDVFLCLCSELRDNFTSALKEKGFPTTPITSDDKLLVPNEFIHIDAFLFGYCTNPNTLRIVTSETEHLCKFHLRKNMVKVTPLVKLEKLEIPEKCAPLFSVVPVQYCVELDLFGLYGSTGPEQKIRDEWIAGFISVLQQLVFNIANLKIKFLATSVIAQLENRSVTPYRHLPCFLVDHENNQYVFSSFYNLLYGNLNQTEFYLGGKILNIIPELVKAELEYHGTFIDENSMEVLNAVSLDVTGIQILNN